MRVALITAAVSAAIVIALGLIYLSRAGLL